MFSIAQLLIPVSAARACGEDIAFSSEVDDIARARLFDDPSLDQGEWVVALKEADWPFVATRCARLIESKSKDLRLAVWLAEAQAKTRRFRGLGDGFAVLAGLCEHYWDGLYPAADEDGDYEQRTGNLGWLLARTPQLVREMPVTEDLAYCLADFDAARQRAASGNGGNSGNSGQLWNSATPEQGPTLAELEAARQRNSPAFNAALLADAEYCLATLGELEAVSDRRLGAEGPAFHGARAALQTVVTMFAPLAGAARSSTTAADAEGQGGAHAGLAHGGAATGDRAQALAQLRQVAEFFRRTEPHSPVAYLADKAASWGELPLHLWLRAVVKDPAVLGQLDELLGSAPD